MTLEVEERGSFLIVSVRARLLENGNARTFKEAVVAAVGEGTRQLILDLSSLEEIDSAGMGALVALLKWVRRFGGSMRLCGVQRNVREPLELSMLHRILPIHTTVEAAIEEQTAALSALDG